MPPDDLETLEHDENAAPSVQRGRVELRFIMILVAAVILLSGGYVLLFGSPTRDRAAIDNTNTNPMPNLQAPPIQPVPAQPPARR